MMRAFLLSVFLVFSGCATQNTGLGTNPNPSAGFNATLDQFQYPFEVEHYQFDSQQQSLTMAYMDVGSRDSAQAVVLLHGKNFSGYYFEQIARDLMERGYRVVIPDQIGFGKSSKPENYQFSFAQLALNTHQLLVSIGVEQYTVVGHSMGGMLATHLSARYEEAARLVLVNPIGLEDYLQYVEFKDPSFFFEKELAKTPEKVRGYQEKNYYKGEWKPEYEALLAPYQGWYEGPDRALIAWNAALTYGPIFSEEIVSLLADSEKETHLILGTRDRTGPGRGWKKEGVTRELGRYDRLGEEIQAANPSIELYELDDLGHLPHYEDYEAFSEVFFSLFVPLAAGN